jgi:hypothetical protein
MQTKIKEVQYNGVIDEQQHWLDEIAAHKDQDDDVSKFWVRYAMARLDDWRKKNER